MNVTTRRSRVAIAVAIGLAALLLLAVCMLLKGRDVVDKSGFTKMWELVAMTDATSETSEDQEAMMRDLGLNCTLDLTGDRAVLNMYGTEYEGNLEVTDSSNATITFDDENDAIGPCELKLVNEGMTMSRQDSDWTGAFVENVDAVKTDPGYTGAFVRLWELESGLAADGEGSVSAEKMDQARELGGNVTLKIVEDETAGELTATLNLVGQEASDAITVSSPTTASMWGVELEIINGQLLMTSGDTVFTFNANPDAVITSSSTSTASTASTDSTTSSATTSTASTASTDSTTSSATTSTASTDSTTSSATTSAVPAT